MCTCRVESRNHLLFECPFSKVVGGSCFCGVDVLIKFVTGI